MADADEQGVRSILAAQKEKYRSVQVHKDIGVHYDVGNLMVSDVNLLDYDALKRDTDSYLKDLTRDNAQLLIGEIWKLPTEKVEDVVVGQLPTPTTVIPREKPIPKPKPPTKWELYANKKGIQKKKRSRMVYDEKAEEWKPRWGYKRVNDHKDDWLLEVPESADKFEDQFEKRAKEKSDRVAKNEYQRLRNIAQMQQKGVKIRPPPPPSGKSSKEQLSQAIVTAKKSTASAGVFQKELHKEPPQKLAGKKRKFEPVTGDMEGERKKALEILDKIQSKQPVLDVNKAVNKQMAHEQSTSGRKQKRSGQSGQKKSKSQIKRLTGAKRARRKGKVK